MMPNLPPSPPAGDRRFGLRYACTWQAFCQTAPGRWWHWAEVRDISATGVQLLTNHPFEVGSHLELDVEISGFILPVRVIHLARQENGYWLVGCTFADGLLLQEADIRALLRGEASR